MHTETDVNPDLVVHTLLEEAGNFRAGQEVIREWLYRYRLALLSSPFGWFVGDFSEKYNPQKLASFPTFAQALAFALEEAERRHGHS